jgi:hypothetical protein
MSLCYEFCGSSFHIYIYISIVLFVFIKNLKIKIFLMIILPVADVRKYERKTNIIDLDKDVV